MVTASENTLDFDKLPRYQKRQFVPENADLVNLETIKNLFNQLIERNIQSSDDLEEWLLDRSELESAVDQTAAVLYIRMTCQTDDQERAQAFKNFIKTIEPVIKPLSDQLNHKFLKELKRYPIDQEKYAIYIRETKADVELFTKENVPLQTEVGLLSQEYQTICGAMTVSFEGEEKTLPQMGKFLLEPDRALREKAWRATSRRRLEDKQKLDDLFDKMLNLRAQIAENAGCGNFCDYKFRELHRFDYTPDDCKKYHESMEQLVVPVIKQILMKRKEDMKLDRLRPWDTSVDPFGRGPLKPFDDVSQLIDKCQTIFSQVNDDLGKQFSDMAQTGLLDLGSRKGKAPGGYQHALAEARKPFIFMNAVGVDNDVRTLLHECGHAFHAIACSHFSLVAYRHGPMEFNEVASMAMELLGGEYLNVFYNEEDETRSKKLHLEDIIFVLVWVATIDAFQHWIYENPNHSQQERKEQWLSIRDRFSGGIVDWSQLEEEHAFLWHRQLHIFEVPFYYIEYGIAQLGALQLWQNSKNDWEKTLTDYQNALALGGSRPLPDIYTMAGIRFDFSEETIAPLMEEVKKELMSLEKI